MIQLKAIFQAKAHITYLAAVHWSFPFSVLWTHNTPPLRFWFFSFGCHFSQKMSFSQPWNCCRMPVAPVHSASPQHAHISWTDLPLGEFYTRAAVYFFQSLVDKQQTNWELYSSVAFWKVWGTIWSFFSSQPCTCEATAPSNRLPHDLAVGFCTVSINKNRPKTV